MRSGPDGSMSMFHRLIEGRSDRLSHLTSSDQATLFGFGNSVGLEAIESRNYGQDKITRSAQLQTQSDPCS